MLTACSPRGPQGLALACVFVFCRVLAPRAARAVAGEWQATSGEPRGWRWPASGKRRAASENRRAANNGRRAATDEGRAARKSDETTSCVRRTASKVNN